MILYAHQLAQDHEQDLPGTCFDGWASNVNLNRHVMRAFLLAHAVFPVPIHSKSRVKPLGRREISVGERTSDNRPTHCCTSAVGALFYISLGMEDQPEAHGINLPAMRHVKSTRYIMTLPTSLKDIWCAVDAVHDRRLRKGKKRESQGVLAR